MRWKYVRWALLSAFAAFAVVFLATAIVVLRRGFSARDEPLSFETFVARSMPGPLFVQTVLSFAVPRAAKQTPNPVPLTAVVMAEPRVQFAKHCAMCHANDGSGRTPIGQHLYPKAADMRLQATQDKTDGELYYTIHNGIRWTGMPAWGQPDNDIDSWKLVHFMRHLSTLSPEEMQRFNPKKPG